MIIFEWVVGVLFGAVLLAALARRIGAPYPAFLALGGVGLAFVPGVPNLELDPGLALALFLASDDARMCTGHDYFVDAGWR